jgi:hypothetical protein
MKLSKKWRKMEARIISGREDDDRPKYPVLDRDARFLSPARRLKRFSEIRDLLCQETVWGRKIVKEWIKGDTRRLYWPDGSYLFVDQKLLRFRGSNFGSYQHVFDQKQRIREVVSRR